jgi:hypothetical protein
MEDLALCGVVLRVRHLKQMEQVPQLLLVDHKVGHMLVNEYMIIIVITQITLPPTSIAAS